MKRISFMLTEPQFVDKSKTVTRRLGWLKAKPGDHAMGVNKCQGLRPGERARLLGEIEFTDVRREPLSAIDQSDVVREGFPDMTPAQFVAMFCKHSGCTPETVITRLEYRYI